MTKEEAIEYLKDERSNAVCDERYTAEWVDVLDMAIEALEQAPTHTSEVAQKAYEDGKKDGYIQRKIETITENESRNDCVDRTEVKKIAKEMYLEVANMELDVKTISDCISYTSSKCREVLENKLQALPSVKQQKQRKGHWIEHPHEWGTNWEYSMYECSECNEYTVGDSDFCPNCGADLREEKE